MKKKCKRCGGLMKKIEFIYEGNVEHDICYGCKLESKKSIDDLFDYSPWYKL